MHFPFKISWCPVCSQGWVEIVKDPTVNELFVMCDECETEWRHPLDAINRKEGIWREHNRVAAPSQDEVEQADWAKFIIEN